jgi:hypothetical protein
MAHEALALYADGEADLPEPRTLKKIKARWKYWSEWEQDYQFFIAEVTLYPLKLRVRNPQPNVFPFWYFPGHVAQKTHFWWKVRWVRIIHRYVQVCPTYF